MTQEGVIQFNLDFTKTAEPIDAKMLVEINAWRHIMHRLKLIGQQRDRYNGYGYGNISVRHRSSDFSSAFVISSTQTGHMEWLTAQHYALVTAWDIAQNHVTGRGMTPPSSESLTHGILYRLNNAIAAVIHVHSPEIWNHAAALKIPATSPDARYGTPEMANQVAMLFQHTGVEKLCIFAMGGHKDGVFAFGDSIETAGSTLVRYLAKAIAIG